MNKKSVFWAIVVFLILINLNFLFSTAEQFSSSTVINHTEKLCVIFWGGGLYQFYKLPEGWEVLDTRILSISVTHKNGSFLWLMWLVH
jgi:hypothetical protein